MISRVPIFVLVGNDGTGKSTLCKLLTSKGQIALERSSPDCDTYGVDPSIIDKMTFLYSYETEYQIDLPEQFILGDTTYQIYWIMLDTDVSIIDQRIKTREYRDKWESNKALFYYRQRYREIAANYGIPVIDVSHKTPEEITIDILQVPIYYREVRKLALLHMNYDFISEHDIENKLTEKNIPISKLSPKLLENIKKLETECNEYFGPDLKKLVKDIPDMKRKILARYLTQGKITIHNHQDNTISLEKDDMTFTFDTNPLFHLIAEGESKKIYRILSNNPYLQNRVIIVLKSTIYSHSKQATGEIHGLSEIRAKGTQLFLEMMARNGLTHSYHAINNYGIILSTYIHNIPPTEIVVKKYLEGTDKHSYYDLISKDTVTFQSGEYVAGPYVRIDWRNPNHLDKNGKNPIENPYYYIIESCVGKDSFFANFVNLKMRPMGDKTISSELLHNIIDVPKTQENVLRLFYTIQYYFRKINLEIKDVCFMLDAQGQVFWSEINQDCMRIKVKDNADNGYDKDIWRTGGSGAKDDITKKWMEFNAIASKYFEENRFHTKEIMKPNTYSFQKEVMKVSSQRNNIHLNHDEIYDHLLNNNHKRNKRVIVTLDLYDQKPVLVQNGKVTEIHSNGDISQAFEKISIFPDILVVDLNGAIENKRTNREIIKSLATKYYIHSGGGLRTHEDIQDILESSARRIVVSSNTQDEFLSKIPKDRLIVELSVNEHNHVLIHGRNTNTQIHIKDEIARLASLGVEAISITFHHTEGLLNGIPKSQIREIMSYVPIRITKVIFAGGISTLEDIDFIWSFPKAIPQLGSAIWKNKLSPADIYAHSINMRIVPAIIQDTNGCVKGLIYMNAESIRKTCEKRILYRYSREFNKVICKGEVSGHYQKVIKISMDCDSDAMLITVEPDNSFCHTGNYSCFSQQTINKANLNILNTHIKSKQNEDSYSGVMMKHSGLALVKVLEEFWEIVTATKESNNVKVHECADLIVHLLMAMSGLGVSLDDILNELNARRWNPRIIKPISQHPPRDPNKVTLAITVSKYTTKTDTFMEDELGVQVIRPQANDRNMKITYQITNKEKYQKYFGTKEVVLVPSRPKDMSWLIAFKRVDGAVTYNTVVENFPEVQRKITEVPDMTLRLCLIKRKGDTINKDNFNNNHKMLIACEHVNHVYSYLRNAGFDAEQFSLDRVIGSSEGYMVNTPKDRYDLCDAVVESGKTLDANNLEIWKPVLDYGQVKIGLYMDIRL